MVRDIVNSTPQWDLPNRPRGVIRQVGGQNTDPQLTLWANTFKHLGLSQHHERNILEMKRAKHENKVYK